MRNSDIANIQRQKRNQKLSKFFYLYVCVFVWALTTTLVLCARSQDVVMSVSVSVRRVHVVFSICLKCTYWCTCLSGHNFLTTESSGMTTKFYMWLHISTACTLGKVDTVNLHLLGSTGHLSHIYIYTYIGVARCAGCLKVLFERFQTQKLSDLMSVVY